MKIPSWEYPYENTLMKNTLTAWKYPYEKTLMRKPLWEYPYENTLYSMHVINSSCIF